MDYTANEFENIVEFWPQGKYWLDAGLLASYHLAAKADAADSIELKLLQKDFERFTTIINAGGEGEVGYQAETGHDPSTAINISYRWNLYFQPGIELQSDYGNWGDHHSFNEQQHYLGPIVYGELVPGLKYEVGYYAGISTAAASSAARFKLEYEMYF